MSRRLADSTVADKRVPLAPGLDHPDRATVDEEEVVGEPKWSPQGGLPYRDAPPGGEIEVRPILEHPAGDSQLPVDLHTRALLGRLTPGGATHSPTSPHQRRGAPP
jgi:hypothetical protein